MRQALTVDGDTTPVGLFIGELGHQIAGDLAQRVTGSPDDETAGHLCDALVGHLQNDALLLDLLDHGLGKDVDLGLLERRLGVVDQLLAKHGQHGRQCLNERDADVLGELRVPRTQVLLQEVVEFTTTAMLVLGDPHNHRIGLRT